MPSEQPEQAQIRKNAERRVKERIAFRFHLILFLILNGFLYVGAGIPALLSRSYGELLSIATVTLCWVFVLAIHGTIVYLRTRVAESMREQEIQREMARMGVVTAPEPAEKPKRGQAQVHLTDDGELEYDEEASEAASATANSAKRT